MRPGFLVIDKPAGITSHDVVAMVRACTGVKKVGHTGTLDPFATGVLPLALGPATKLIRFLDESMKVYDATVQLGQRTDTGDPTGVVVEEKPVPALTETSVRAVLDQFEGELMQTPPAYSAVKKNGKALYKYARAGETVTVDARPITVYGIELLELGETSMRIVIRCGRGTYARVLAEDIAVALGTVAHLTALCRLQSGPFDIDNSLSLDELAEVVAEQPDLGWEPVFRTRGVPREERVQWRHRDQVRDAVSGSMIRPIQALSHLPMVDVDEAEATRIRNGGLLAPPTSVGVGQRFLLVFGDRLIAIGERKGEGVELFRIG